jgi:hypothetical protein
MNKNHLLRLSAFCFLLIVLSFNLKSQSKINYNEKDFLFIEKLQIEIDHNSQFNNKTVLDKFNFPLHRIFFEYFIENAMNRRPVIPSFTDKTITFNKLIIPKQNSGNITSEIENYGMELVREFTKRNYFNSIDYHVESNEILKIYIK